MTPLAAGCYADHSGVHRSVVWMVCRRPITWVNTPVLLQAIERYEEGRLPRSMQLWLRQLLELDQPVTGPLRPHC